MRCLVVSCVFPPEPVVSSRTSADVAEALARRGHDVTVLSPFPSRPAGRLYPGHRRRLYHGESSAAGYRLIRCYARPSASGTMASRLLENLSFGLTAAVRVLFGRRADVIYANTWPVFAAGLLTLAARLRRVPVVLSVQDLYPESLVSQGRIRPSSPVVRTLFALDRRVAHSAAALVVISETFATAYRERRRVPSERIHVVPNWLRPQVVSSNGHSAAQLRREKAIPANRVLLVYGGNIGKAAGVAGLIRAVAAAPAVPPVHLLVAGDGSEANACRSLAAEVAPCRVSWHSPWPEEETGLVLGASDILVLPTEGHQARVSVPSKLIAYLLAARPVIVVAARDTATARAVEESGAGWITPPGDVDALAAAIAAAAACDPAARAARGRAAREYAMDHFGVEACLPQVLSLLERIGGR